MKIYLINGPNAGLVKEVPTQGLSLGRETDNDISILMGGVSRYHAKIMLTADGWIIADLGSTNGTKVNGNKITAPCLLHNSDFLNIGEQIIRIELGGDEKLPEQNNQALGFQINLGNPDPIAPASSLTGVPPIVSQPDASFIQQAGMPNVVAQPNIQNSVVSEGMKNPEPAVFANASNVPMSASPQNEVNSFAIQDATKTNSVAGTQTDLTTLNTESLFKGSAGTDTNGTEEVKKSGRLANLIFYGLVGLAVIILLAVFARFLPNEPSVKEPRPSVVKNENKKVPLTLLFVQQKVIGNNIFRFTFEIENGQIARATLQDLNSEILHKTGDIAIFTEDSEKQKSREWMNKQNALKQLEEVVRKSGFLTAKLPPPQIDLNSHSYYKLSVCLDAAHNEYLDYTEIPSGSVDRIAEAINDFAHLSLKIPITQDPDSLKQEALRAFELAENRYQNWQARPENLMDAYDNYQSVIQKLNFFKNKPEEWHKAQENAAKVKEIRDREVKSRQDQALLLWEKGNYKMVLEMLKEKRRFLKPGYDDEEIEKTKKQIDKCNLVMNPKANAN